jgi:3-hydroxyacyl-[acyl-carrier-protein] dehydratase
VLDHLQIAALMPHTPPFLFVDRVIELVPGKSGKGIKNITINDPLLMGHFPGRPIMPGVLIAEACGQLAAIVCASEKSEESEERAPGEQLEILAMIEKFKFLRKVVPGDQLILEATIGKRFQNMIRMEVRALVGRNLVAEGVLIATRGA